MHITDLKKFQKCKRLMLLSQKETSNHISYYNINIDVNESIARFLDIENYQSGVINQSSSDTKVLASISPWIFRARFNYKDVRCKIPLIYLANGHCKLYFVSYSNQQSDDITNYQYCLYILQKNRIIVDDIYSIYLNKDYVYQDSLQDKELWICTNKIGKSSIIKFVKTQPNNIKETIKEIRNLNELPEATRTSNCAGRNRCSFYTSCFPLENDIPTNSILTLVSSQNKHQMFDKGIRYLKNADLSLLEGSKVQYAQIKADQNNGLFCDTNCLSSWLDKFNQLPISFLDFEWDLYPIPPYQKMKPFDVLVFQYSLHVYDGSNLQHYQYIGEGDCRKELVESLINNVPKEGIIFAYNAKGAEKMRIKELMDYYPEHAEVLENINNRIYDLADPFTSGMVYCTEMAGSFTLKTIEGMIDDKHSYHDLDCGNGIEAVEIHRQLCKELDLKKKEKFRQELFEYCGLDSYSLYKVYCWLHEIIRQ